MADKVADSSAFNLICTTSNERMCVSTVSIVGGRVRDRLPMLVSGAPGRASLSRTVLTVLTIFSSAV
jgi:hypothetical protein